MFQMSKEDVRKLKQLFEAVELREHSIDKSESGGSPLVSGFERDAEDFLRAAEDAFEVGNYAGALTDAKRAIHCQIDEVMAALGYTWKRTGIRKKLDTVRQCGFAAPRIIHKVNAARNLLEHEYVNPSANKAAEALDIATLFVHASRRHLDGFMGEFYVGNPAERVDTFHFSRELAFAFNDRTRCFKITAHEGVTPETVGLYGKRIGEVSVSAPSVLFPSLVRLTLAGARDDKIVLAFHELFQLFRAAKT
jgi:HEPN domain-containing protein